MQRACVRFDVVSGLFTIELYLGVSGPCSNFANFFNSFPLMTTSTHVLVFGTKPNGKPRSAVAKTQIPW